MASLDDPVCGCLDTCGAAIRDNGRKCALFSFSHRHNCICSAIFFISFWIVIQMLLPCGAVRRGLHL